MGGWEKKTEEEKEKLIYEEESIIFSLTMLFAQHMMYLRVPTNACVEIRKIQHLKKMEYERRMQMQNNGMIYILILHSIIYFLEIVSFFCII